MRCHAASTASRLAVCVSGGDGGSLPCGGGGSGGGGVAFRGGVATFCPPAGLCAAVSVLRFGSAYKRAKLFMARSRFATPVGQGPRIRPTTCMCGPASTVLHQVPAARSQCRREIKRPQARPGLPHLPSSIVRGVTTIRSVTDADGCSCLASDQRKAGFGTGSERLQPGSTVDHARLHGMCRYMLALSVA